MLNFSKYLKLSYIVSQVTQDSLTLQTRCQRNINTTQGRRTGRDNQNFDALRRWGEVNCMVNADSERFNACITEKRKFFLDHTSLVSFLLDTLYYSHNRVYLFSCKIIFSCKFLIKEKYSKILIT